MGNSGRDDQKEYLTSPKPKRQHLGKGIVVNVFKILTYLFYLMLILWLWVSFLKELNSLLDIFRKLKTTYSHHSVSTKKCLSSNLISIYCSNVGSHDCILFTSQKRRFNLIFIQVYYYYN